MAVFDPELAARMKMPKELLDKSSELHFALHVGRSHIYASLYNFSESKCFWKANSEVPAGMSVYKFIYQRNWIEGVFRKCTITFDSDTTALIPQSLFRPEAASDYLEMQHGVQQAQVGFIELPEAEAVICFEEPDWQNEVVRHFPNARVIPMVALLTRLAAARLHQGYSLFLIAVSSGSASILAVQNKSIVLMATHEAKTPEDVLYHVSNAAMRLQIDLENCRVELMEASADDSLSQLLKRYAGEVSQLKEVIASTDSAITQLHYLCA